MYTVIETPVYSNKVSGILAEDERDAFAAFISANPMSGTVVRGSGGVRKVRWAQQGRGKSGGASSTIPAHELRLIKETIDDD